MTQVSAPPAQFSRLLAYAQLMRAPNVFTAMADVLMGYFITHTLPLNWLPLMVLVAASSCLYLAGMVLNDVFDVEQDAEERPHRPIPSGRISIAAARMLGLELLIVGCALGWLASFLGGSPRAGLVATALAALVFAYDRILKKTPLGPLAMGGCRFLNVLLGMSLAVTEWHTVHLMVASGIGVYIVGVTWFARTEAASSSRAQLTGGLIVMAAGLGLLLWFPNWIDHELDLMTPPRNLQSWNLLMVVLAILIGRRVVSAIYYPVPERVQLAVKDAILSLIVLDAAVTLAVRGPQAAVCILLLLIPTFVLARWVYST